MAKLFPTANLEKNNNSMKKKRQIRWSRKTPGEKKNNFDKISFYYVRPSIANAAGIR